MAKPSDHMQQNLAKLFTFKKEEIDFLEWMKKVLLASPNNAAWILKTRLATINKKLDGMANKFPALRALFNNEFITEIISSNHAAIAFVGSSLKKDFATHTEDTLNRTIRIFIETINLCLLTATIATSKSNVIVISAGSEGTLEQQHPTFTKSLPQDKTILILNADPNFTPANKNSESNNIAIYYFGTIFGNINKIKDLTYFTQTLLGPLRQASLFCKDVIEEALLKGRQHFVLQSFFNPGLFITELAQYLGMKYPEKIGSQLEIIGGYDEVFPVLLHSKDYFIQHKKRLEKISQAVEKLVTQKNALEAELKTLESPTTTANDQTVADQQKTKTEKIDSLNKQITRLSEDIRKLEAEKLDVNKILTKHEGYNGIRNKPQNYDNARKEFADQNFGELYPNLSKLPANDLLKASPTLRKPLTAAYDAKKTAELQQQKPPSQTPKPKTFGNDPH